MPLANFRASNANTFAEHWVRTVRHECLNKLIILNRAHLKQVLTEYVAYYNDCRPHQGLDQQTPIVRLTLVPSGEVRSRLILNELIHDHHRAAKRLEPSG